MQKQGLLFPNQKMSEFDFQLVVALCLPLWKRLTVPRKAA
jgi:hypothetical protein